LAEHPFVLDAEVTASVEAQGAHEIMAWVVLEAGTEPTGDLADQLERHVTETLGGLARPRRVGYVEAFPQSASRTALRQALARLAEHSTERVRGVTQAQLESELSVS